LDEARNLIQDACYYYNLDYILDDEVNPTVAVLMTKTAGEKHFIDISGHPDVLAFLGLHEAKINGTDALITDINNGLIHRADGNQITISGNNGEEIKFNVQLMFNGVERVDDPVNPVTDINLMFTFGDGATESFAININIDGTDPTLPPAVTRTDAFAQRDMSFDIKAYGPIMLQIGPSYNNAMAVHIPKINAETLGIVEYKGGVMHLLVNYRNHIDAGHAITKVDEAINTVSTVRSRIGAFQNRLEATVRSLDQARENTEHSRSIIADTDMAKESTAFAQYSIMHQAALAILAQANQRPQQILSLLQ
jgi:flagellin-like hook-associated protein FlgL